MFLCSLELIVLYFIELEFFVQIHLCYEYENPNINMSCYGIQYHTYKQNIYINIWIIILWCFGYHIPWSTTQQFLRYSLKRKTFVFRPSLFLRYFNNYISSPKHLQIFVKSILIILQFSDLVLLSPTCSPRNYSHYNFVV